MPQPTPADSLQYAEDHLGVHSVYTDVLAKREALSNKLLELNNLKNRRRQLESYRADREMEVLENEQGKHPESSATWLKEHVKVVYSNTADIRETRDELTGLLGEIELIEFEIDILNQDIKIAVARLHELGGYLHFLSLIKEAQLYDKYGRNADQSRTLLTNPTTDEGNPW